MDKIRDLVNELTYGNIVERLVSEKGMSVSEAREHLGKMTFAEYRAFTEATMVQPTNTYSTIKATYPDPANVDQTQEPNKVGSFKAPTQYNPEIHQDDERQQQQQDQVQQEDITPPSGQTIGPGVASNTNQATNAPTQVPNTVKSLWPGKGVPPQVGMTVGLKGPSNVPIPGQITTVDTGAKGVKVRNPTTGQEQWTAVDQLQPYMVGQAQQQPQAPASPNLPTKTQEDLSRLLELAGIKETASAGATGAGAIAVAPTAMGTIKRRPTESTALTPEYTPTIAKTVIGDTKPHQASGKLSADLAASGKKSASRINNGRKRK